MSVEAFDLEFRLHQEALTRDGFADDPLVAPLAEVRPLVVRYHDTAATIVADRDLSAEGRAKKLAALREEHEAGIAAWHAAQGDPLEAGVAAEEQALAATVAAALAPPSPEAVRVMTTTFLQFDAVERMAMFADADPQTRRVLEVAHEQLGQIPVRRPDGTFAWERLLDEAQLERFREARLEAADADASARLRRLQRMRSTYRPVAASARAALR